MYSKISLVHLVTEFRILELCIEVGSGDLHALVYKSQHIYDTI